MNVKFTEDQKQFLRQSTERMESLDRIIIERVENPDVPVPFNLIIQSRILALGKQRVKLRGNIRFLREESERDRLIEIELIEKRLLILDGKLSELHRMNEFLRSIRNRDIEQYPDFQ